jgi:hypothetical protein
MTRSLTAGVQTAIAAELVRPFLAAELDFASGMVRLNSTPLTLRFDSGAGAVDFLGVGRLGEFSAVSEGAELQAYGVAIKLSGVAPEHVAIALGEHYQGRAARIWLGFLDANHAIVPNPALIFQGRMDDMPISLGETAEIAVNVESRLADWERPRVRRYTDADQQERHPGDLGCQFVAQMVEKELVWGRA